MMFSHEETRRYSRQTILPGVGALGQKRLKEARVLIVGTGGLGSPVALYLAGAGVGTLGLVDFDRVDLSNLPRQIVHDCNEIGNYKVESAKHKLEAINPHIQIVPFKDRLTHENVLSILSDFDVVVDATDNFTSRYLISDACVILKKTCVYGAIFRFEGMVSVFSPHLGGPCYRCIYATPPPAQAIPNCADAGVFGAVCGVIGSLQASETLKVILDLGKRLSGRLLCLDLLEMSFRTIEINKDANCRTCCNLSKGNILPMEEISCLNKEKKMSNSENLDDISVEEVCEMMKSGKQFHFIDVRNDAEQQICKIEGTRLIPFQDLQSRISELPKDQLIVLHCHHGGRSKRALEILKTHGYTNLKNLAGGIDRWADVVDPSMAKY